jgi:hypothetical protein
MPRFDTPEMKDRSRDAPRKNQARSLALGLKKVVIDELRPAIFNVLDVLLISLALQKVLGEKISRLDGCC